MQESAIRKQGHKAIVALHKRMKPEERLVAYFNQSRLIYQLYLAGVKYRSEQSSKSQSDSGQS